MLSNTKTMRILKEQTTAADLNGVGEQQIADAEAALGVRFAPIYREILKTYGYIDNEYRNICGICDKPAVNVLALDQKLRQNGFHMGNGIYPIMTIVDDVIYVGQDAGGALYTITEHEGPTSLCGSLDEYLMSL